MAKNETLKVASTDPVEIEDPKPVLADDTEEVPLDEVKVEKKEEKKVETQEEEEEEEDAPPQPARPVDQLTRVTNDLKEAFPNTEEKIIKAVLIASQGAIDPAFNALLYLSDPQFKPEIPEPVVAPAAAPRRNVGDKYGGLTDDELLARKLQKEFELEDQRSRARRERRKKQGGRVERDANDSPDEFEQLKETFTQGLEEARTTLNGWVSGLAKKFDGVEDDDETFSNTSQNQQTKREGTKLFGALGGSSFNGTNRRQTRFDEDPQIINQHEFDTKISLNDEKDLPVLPGRRDKPAVVKPSVETATGASAPASSLGAAPPGKKWQPLNSDVPANSDAFLVTDSEDEEK